MTYDSLLKNKTLTRQYSIDPCIPLLVTVYTMELGATPVPLTDGVNRIN